MQQILRRRLLGANVSAGADVQRDRLHRKVALQQRKWQ